MALFSRKKKQQEEAPIETKEAYDYSFDDDYESIIADLPTEPLEDDLLEDTESETPDEALAKFRAAHPYPSEKSEDAQEEAEIPRPRILRKQEEEEDGRKKRKHKKKRKHDLDVDDVGSGRFLVLRRILKVAITGALILLLVMIAASYYVDIEQLGVPKTMIVKVVEPAQSAFSTLTGSMSGYLRRLKLRATLEEEYESLRAENEQLVYQAMLADELQIQLSQYEDLYDEINANRNMNPVAATVIGKYDSNYFSTFTINKGSRDGIEPYMAVTVSGALIGYTETVSASASTVRTIIDSDASIAALIQSSRDQGTVRGTLGVDGKAMCRMYYLSEDHLPRPGDIVVTSGVGMSFPKGIPVGTVRESTRGMESNKSFIVVEPTADFEHIEYVIVYRYQPTALAVQGRDSNAIQSEFVPLVTARPYPTLRIGASSYFLPTATPDPATVTASPTPTLTPEPTPSPTPRPTPTPAPKPEETVFEYQVVATGPTPTPTPSPSPTPTPFITYSPSDLTWEDE